MLEKLRWDFLTHCMYVVTSQVQLQLVEVLIMNLSASITWLSLYYRRHRRCLATLVTSSSTSMTSTTTAPSSTSRRLATTLFTLATVSSQVSYWFKYISARRSDMICSYLFVVTRWLWLYITFIVRSVYISPENRFQ